jgi:hypothetical protein
MTCIGDIRSLTEGSANGDQIDTKILTNLIDKKTFDRVTNFHTTTFKIPKSSISKSPTAKYQSGSSDGGERQNLDDLIKRRKQIS